MDRQDPQVRHPWFALSVPLCSAPHMASLQPFSLLYSAAPLIIGCPGPLVSPLRLKADLPAVCLHHLSRPHGSNARAWQGAGPSACARRSPCHVVYTEFRPTPLQHFAFPAGADGLFLVVDERGAFRSDNFTKAVAALTAAAPEPGAARPQTQAHSSVWRRTTSLQGSAAGFHNRPGVMYPCPLQDPAPVVLSPVPPAGLCVSLCHDQAGLPQTCKTEVLPAL